MTPFGTASPRSTSFALRAGGRRTAHRGVSLIEVLVAIVVLTIGLLGLAGLQASGMRVGHSSHYRAQAAQLAYDMADRMRANVESARNGGYTRALSASDEPADPSRPIAEINEWMSRVRQLPGGQGGIEVDQATAIATVTVRWDDSRGAVNDDNVRAAAKVETFQLTGQIWNNN